MTWHPAKASLLGPAFLVTGLCRVPGDDGTRQRIFLNFFVGCPMTWHPTKASLLGPAFLVTALCRVPGDDGTRQRIFLIFFKFLCRVPHDLAPGKGFFGPAF